MWKKIALSVLFIGGFGTYAAYNASQTNAAAGTGVVADAATGPTSDDATASDNGITISSQDTTAHSSTRNMLSGENSDSDSESESDSDNSPSSAPTNTAARTTTVPAVSTKPAASSNTKPSNGLYKDGTYTGGVADAYYGNIQVQATVSGGKLTNVKFLQYPNDRGTSIMINRQAMPTLAQEAIRAQSSNVDGVSGASDSSAAFVQSLHSALSQAKA